MNELVDFSGVRYAVIEGLHTKTGRERIVIAYPSEQSLRDLIAGSCIIAFGFSSREEALAGGRVCVPTGTAYQRMTEGMASRETERQQQLLSWAELRGETGLALRRLARLLVACGSAVITSAIVIFSSRNTLLAAFHMALGSSV